MTIRELIDQFEIQGGFCIKQWNDEYLDYGILAYGDDFDIDKYGYGNDVYDRRITYMYAADGILNIEVE